MPDLCNPSLVLDIRHYPLTATENVAHLSVMHHAYASVACIEAVTSAAQPLPLKVFGSTFDEWLRVLIDVKLSERTWVHSEAVTCGQQ